MSAPPKASAVSTGSPSSQRLGGKASRWITVILLVAVSLIFFSVANDDWFTIVNYTLIAAIAALALNVLSGYTGQVSLGIAFFMAIGAYTAAYLGGTVPSSPLEPLGLGLPFIIGYCLTCADLHRTIYLHECSRYHRWSAGALFPRTGVRRCDIRPAKLLLWSGINIRPAIFLVDPDRFSAGGSLCVQRHAFARRARLPSSTR